MFRPILTCYIASTLSLVSTLTLAQQNEKERIASNAPTLAPLFIAPTNIGIKNTYIIVLKTPAMLKNDQQSLQLFTQKAAANLSNQYAFEVGKMFHHSLSGFVATLTKEQLKMLRSDDMVEFIEQDQIISLDPISAIESDQSNPVWGLDRIDQRSLPLNNNYHYSYDGTGVTAYVIDTGVTTTHTEFGGRAHNGYDFVDNDYDSTDCNGHGTHVAGTIGGQLYGVAKKVDIVGVRVLGCNGSGTTSGVISGVDWVASNANKPAVANMSLGGGASNALDIAVANAVKSGVSFMLAAGNSNASACNYSPAREPTGVTVGSTMSNDGRSSFSNWGSCVDIFAPGSSIKSAWYDGGYRTISGTSMATPHVAGVAALYLQEDSTLTPSQLASLIDTRASIDKVTDTRGTANKLLFSLADSSCEPDCGNPAPDDELSNGVPKPDLSANKNEQQHYYIDVPANKSLTVRIHGGFGDADLYVRFGTKPSKTSWDCRPYLNGNNEVCTIESTNAGRYYVMLDGYSSYSGVSLEAKY
ncbi:S8 family peptidase [Vibrio sp. S4M6]|uniref:S8 family peptidase n=1 Tax=Vibrio sinus TaxID=2946865 RepID=UPI00202A0B0E|nr:S8 family peptidase [Vibrio sinus]MCL9780651.1 S8 family peptidase [Vibrio sinus]